MGVFPRDCEIPISKLIHLWIAEGFLAPRIPKDSEELGKPHTSKDLDLEKFGERYLQDLIDRNLILVCKRSCDGKIKTCSMHDLLWDVCVQHAKEENFLHVLESEALERPARRLSIHPDYQHLYTRNDFMSSYRSLHSLFCIASSSKPIKEHKIAVNLLFMRLRVLDVLEVHFDKFPHQIIKLHLLRYLAVRYDGPFPPSMSKLQNLETIVHHHCSSRMYPFFPMVIWSMPNLRHFYVRPGYDMTPILWGFGFLLHLPSLVGVRNLKWSQSLQTLVGVRNLKWSESMVSRVPNLKKLVISYDASSSVDWSQYQLERLVELHQLESLKITMETAVSHDPPKLAFPQKLKKLSLSGCGIPWSSMAAIGALPNLEALKLRREAFCGHSWETVEGGFPQLTFLQLEEMSFTSWETDAAHFPRLRRLVMRSCGSLEEFPSPVGDIPTLEMIQLINCHPSAVDSATQMLKDLEEEGNDYVKLDVVSPF